MSDEVAIILEVKAITNNGETSGRAAQELFRQKNHLNNVQADTMDCSDRYSYPGKYNYVLCKTLK